MAGPTPVSALIHAATMVTAGVYLVARCSAVFVLAPDALTVVAWVGAATAIFAASIGLAQNDIKKVLAYSTVSQLGYMFLACGVGAFGAGMFHVFTHAFFKKTGGLGPLVARKWLVDEAYEKTIFGPFRKIGTVLWRGFDSLVIDGVINASAFLVELTGDLMRFFTTGNVRNYALTLTLGVLAFTLYVWIR